MDHINNAALYNGLGEKLTKALEYLKSTDFSSMEPGRYDIDGDNIFAMVNQYDTRPLKEAELEAHKVYIDIQYVHSGVEKIGYAPLGDQTPSNDFNTDQDCGFYQGEPSLIDFKEGMFAIFYPTDLHMPGIGEDKSAVKKIVVKVRA